MLNIDTGGSVLQSNERGVPLPKTMFEQWKLTSSKVSGLQSSGGSSARAMVAGEIYENSLWR